MWRRMVLAAAICASGMGATTALAESATPHISLTGTGQIAVAPDMAHITIGMAQEAKTAADAMEMISVAMAAVMDRLMQAGIAEEHMQTGSLRLDQRFSRDNDAPRKVVGYATYADVQVQVYALDDLGQVLDAVVRDGASQMNGLRFDVADKAPHLDAARRAAVADALQKAQVFTDAAGVSVGQIMSISEGGASHRPMPMMTEAAFDSMSRSVPIATGELKINATVAITWGLAE